MKGRETVTGSVEEGSSLVEGDGAKMTALGDIAGLVQVQEQSTVSRTILRAEGARLVLFAFDEGETLTEHTAAMPVLFQSLEGELKIMGGDDTFVLAPGDIIHMDTRLPHSVTALTPAKLLLTMLDSRATPKHSRAGLGE